MTAVRWGGGIGVLALALACLAQGCQPAVETRTATPMRQVNAVGGPVIEGELYARSHAVVIGVDAYSVLKPLKGAVRDAEAVASEFEQRGIEVTLLRDGDATRGAIAGLLGDELRGRLGQNDRVIVYFAGHGTTVGAGEHTMGYLMPVEGDFARPSATGISMGEVQGWLRTYPSQHVMFVADACYAGLALPQAETRGEAPPEHLSRLAALPVSLTLVAGGRDEQVIDNYKGHGLFTWHFIEGLRGRADFNGDTFVTGLELGAYVQEGVAQVAAQEFSRRQHPHMGQRGEGQMIFKVLGKGGAGLVARPEPVARPGDGHVELPSIRPRGHRVALIIGNGAYSTPLTTARADAEAIAAQLRAEGYTVLEHHDLTHKAMRRAILEFGEALAQGGAGWFYYSGFGVQIDGDNYLLPVDVEMTKLSDARIEGVPMKSVLTELEAARTSMSVVMVEASYEVPFLSGPQGLAVNEGLAPLQPPPNTLVAFSNTPNSAVARPEGARSRFTEALVENLARPGWPVQDAIAMAGAEVQQESGGKQAPWAASELREDLFMAESSLGVPSCPDGTSLAGDLSCVPMLAMACPDGAHLDPSGGCRPGSLIKGDLERMRGLGGSGDFKNSLNSDFKFEAAHDDSDGVDESGESGESGQGQAPPPNEEEGPPSEGLASRRVALVIGNGAYEAPHGLAGPRRDAAAMAAALEGLGFGVELALDADGAELSRRFKALKVEGNVVVVYFAGHGGRSKGQDLIFPTDARLVDGAGGVSLARLMGDLARRRPKAATLILDAPRGLSAHGVDPTLGPLAHVQGVGVVAATSPGRGAAPGHEDQGKLTQALAAALRTPGLSLSAVVERAGSEVVRSNAGHQRPWSWLPDELGRWVWLDAPMPTSPSALSVCPRGTLRDGERCMAVSQEVECPPGKVFVVGRGCSRLQ